MAADADEPCSPQTAIARVRRVPGRASKQMRHRSEVHAPAYQEMAQRNDPPRYCRPNCKLNVVPTQEMIARP
jgi:hypothetical protein